MKRLLKFIVFVGALAGAAWALRDQLMPPPQQPSGSPPAFRTPEHDGTTEVAADTQDLELVNGIGPVRVGQLAAEGISTFAELIDADAVDLATKLAVSVSQVEDWVDQAKRHT